MSDVRTYTVFVYGYDPVDVAARSASQAHYRAFLDFRECRTVSFYDFLLNSRVAAKRNAKPLPRITVCGKAATEIHRFEDGSVRFIYDGQKHPLVAHRLDVGPAAAPAPNEEKRAGAETEPPSLSPSSLRRAW